MASPLTVAFVYPKFEAGGGGELYVLDLARGLAERGHRLHLFGRRASACDVPAGATFHRVGALPLGRALKTWSFAQASARVVGRCRERFDVVQGFAKTTCQTVHQAGGGVHRAFLERRPGGGRTLYDRVALAVEDELFASRSLAAVVCPSRWVAAEVARFYPGAGGRVSVIPNGVDTARFRPDGRAAARAELAGALGLPAASPWLLFAGTNFRLKGLDAALEALALLPDARLLVAGGDEAGPYAAKADALGVGERVRFLGMRRDMPALCRAVDALVHPTLYDPFGNVCAEALASGTPVVTTVRAGAADLLAEGRGGRVIAVEAPPEALAAAVGEVLAEGEAGRAAARRAALPAEFSAHLDAVEALYRRVAARG